MPVWVRVSIDPLDGVEVGVDGGAQPRPLGEVLVVHARRVHVAEPLREALSADHQRMEQIPVTDGAKQLGLVHVDVRGVDVREGDGVDEGHVSAFFWRGCADSRLANVQRLACVPSDRDTTMLDSEGAG